MNLKQEAASGIKWSGVSSGVVSTFHFITLAILARLLSPSDFGLMGMIMVVIGFARLFADMGISNAIIYRQDVTREGLSSLYWLNIVAGMAVFFIVCASVPLVVAFYHEPRLYDLIYLAALIFLITPFGQQFEILLQKELQFKQLAGIEMIGCFAYATISITLAFGGKGVFSLVWGQLAGTSLRVVLLSYWGWRNWRPCWHFSRQDLRGYVSFGLYQMGEKTVNYFNCNLDYLLIGSLLGAKSLGFYTLAYNLVLKPLSMINPIITKVAFPVFSRVQNDTARLKRGYLRVLQLLSSVNFPMMGGLAVLAPVAIPIIFGEQWLPSIILVQILTVVGLLRSIGNPVGSLALARGRADLCFKWNVALIITQLPCLYLGAKSGGTVGVAVAFVILMGIYTIFNYPVLIRTLLGPCLREYVLSLWPSLWMSLAMGGAVLCVTIMLEGLPPELLLFMQILTGLAIYAVLAICSQRLFLLEMKQMLWPSRGSA